MKPWSRAMLLASGCLLRCLCLEGGSSRNEDARDGGRRCLGIRGVRLLVG